MPAHLCHPGELKFAKGHLTDNELYEQCGVNTVLPRPHHPDLDQVPAKHPTRALAGAIHYQLRKRMFTKFATSQTDVADLFQVERKKFFTSITGREYEAGKKQTKAEKTKMAGTTDKKNHTWTGRILTNCNYRSRSQNATNRGHQTKEEIQVHGSGFNPSVKTFFKLTH